MRSLTAITVGAAIQLTLLLVDPCTSSAANERGESDECALTLSLPDSTPLGQPLDLRLTLRKKNQSDFCVLKPISINAKIEMFGLAGRHITAPELWLEFIGDKTPSSIQLPGPVADYSVCHALELTKCGTDVIEFDLKLNSWRPILPGPFFLFDSPGRLRARATYRSNLHLHSLEDLMVGQCEFGPKAKETGLWRGVLVSEWEDITIAPPLPAATERNETLLLGSDPDDRLSALAYFSSVSSPLALEWSERLLNTRKCSVDVEALAALVVLCSHDAAGCAHRIEALERCDSSEGLRQYLASVRQAFLRTQ